MNASLDRARIFQLFSAAMEQPSGVRDEFLRQHGGDDARVVAEVRALLAAASGDLGDTGSMLGGAEPEPGDLAGQQFGHFRLTERIGRGGMGVVYAAVRTDGLPLAVAVKLLRGAIGGDAGRRFAGEARLLARLNHPAIARLIDFGVQDGQGWLAMELVRGLPIDEYCDARRLGIRPRVKLLAQIAGAIAHAHRSLVVHRDIKPTNVLVNEEGQPKLIDFGIASLMSGAAAGRDPTYDVRRLFTPNYAAPEQVRGDPITVATDIFGLGALAYRLLCGRVPYREATSPAAYILSVTRQDVEPASRAAADLRLSRQLRGDLDAILLQALDRDPERRYASALDLQADLHRYLDGLPVSAHAPSVGYRLAKFARRHALALTLGSLLLLSLAAGLVMYALQARSVAQARNMSARRGEFLERLLQSADPNTGHKDITVAALLDAAARQTATQQDNEPLVAASMDELIAQTDDDLGRYPQGLAAVEQAIGLLRAHQGSALDLATALGTQGDLLRNSSRYLDSVVPLQEAIRLLTGASGQQVALAHLYNTLGSDYLNASAHEHEAEAALRQSIALFDAAHSPEVGNALGDLGTMYNVEGRYAEAEPLLREGIARLLTFQSPDRPDILSFKNNLAGLLTYTRRAAEGEALYRQVWESRQRVLGPDHPLTYFSAATLADNLLQQHRFAEAALVALPAAQALERTEGPEHAWTLYGWLNYGLAACQSGQGDAGLAALNRVAAGRDRLYGHDDWRTLSTRLALATCLVALQRYAQAEPLLLQAVQGLETQRGPAFRRTQAGYETLRELYLGLKRPAEAARWAARIQP